MALGHGPTLSDLVGRLLPDVSRPNERADWPACPLWPPDVFAVAGEIVRRSGCHTRTRYLHSACGSLFSAAYPDQITEAARKWWEEPGKPPPGVARLWAVLHDGGAATIDELPEAVSDAAMELLLVADEACAGIGYAPLKPDTAPAGIGNAPSESDGKARPSPFADAFFIGHRELLRHGQAPPFLPHLPHSICRAVPPHEVCVQPKAAKVEPGVTVRNLTFHLSLLPGRGDVTVRWLLGPKSDTRAEGEFNLLLVPFPYRVEADDFRNAGPYFANPVGDGGRFRFFAVEQTWLHRRGQALTAADVAGFLRGLIAEAGKTPVHGIVLPELALEAPFAHQVALELSRTTGIELFIAGAAGHGVGSELPQNLVYGALIDGAHRLTPWTQTKHHRWWLERSQIRKYGLGGQLDPECRWAEWIDVSNRRYCFYAIRSRTTVCCLVCEDLAREDAVKDMIRAVGPNLIVALLLDEHQRRFRWSAKAAAALADDPGAAVLVFTSAALIGRVGSGRHPAAAPICTATACPLPPAAPAADWTIALWKDGREEVELTVPPGAHGYLLGLTMQAAEQRFTIDGRSDGGRTVSFVRAPERSRAVAHPTPPAWL
ncbi:hypothetical protein VT84_12440 [Gemmata sp. SH-PL17]|uniref:hypothetical protein n=1 Tax=Gemmata sp. SH-PL17 TaxID=1630693 RepID=UPI00078CEE05|nr:hypothetical protein [Gemmata sp. SH-PL17]AMV25199.1 hypothetical protein VT84_12440 [Gemmata sp. SH-PL17]